MSEPDLSRLPTGDMGWASLVEYVTAADDRVERYFLEVKSEVDLNEKRDRHKVAKFILAAANRDPVTASRRFVGYALMVLGVGGGTAVGIPGFEAKDLAKDVQKFAGPSGPGWDYHRVPTGGENDVVVIVVDPPTGVTWPCLADGEGMANGDVYIRADGETRKANGAELAGMFARAGRQSAAVDVAVELVGEVVAAHVDETVLAHRLAMDVFAMRAKVVPRPLNSVAQQLLMPTLASLSNDHRSKEEYLAEVDAWGTQRDTDLTAGVRDLAAAACAGVQLRLRNLTTTFLQEVRIEVEFDGDIRAVEWSAERNVEDLDLLPGRPDPWGTSSLRAMTIGGRRNTVRLDVATGPGRITIKKEQPAGLVLSLKDLRPEEDWSSPDDDVVLVLLVDEKAVLEAVTGRWRMTVAGFNEVFRGDLTVPVRYVDVRDVVEQHLFPTPDEVSVEED